MWLQIISGQLPACKALCALGGCVRQNVKLCFSVCTCDQVCLLIGTSCLFFPSISPLEVDVWCVCVWKESKRDSFVCVCVLACVSRVRKETESHSCPTYMPNQNLYQYRIEQLSVSWLLFFNYSFKKDPLISLSSTLFISIPPLLNAEHTPCAARGKKNKKNMFASFACRAQRALMVNSS